MVVTCDIEFDNNPYGTYFAGQVLTGRITLKSDKVKQVKGVALKIDGFAYTSWSESSSHSTTVNGETRTESRTTHYSGREDYIASITYLVGSEGSTSNVIEPGIHSYTFATHIPTTCPSSFEGHYGHIRYTIRVALIRPWKFDQTFTKGFTVLKIMDLNYDTPLLRMPTNSEVQKTFCCGPCKSDPLKLHINIPQSGYVPGQNIPVSILVTNDSNVPVEEVKLQLVMLVCYYSQSPTTETQNERLVVTKLKGEPVLRHCKKLFNYELHVPATPPTCFNLCRIIQIAYQVEVEAKVKGIHANQVLCVPVTIGNVPLMGVIQQQPSNNMGMQRGLMGARALDEKGVEGEDGLRGVDVYAVETELVNGDENVLPTMNGVACPPSPWAADASIPPPAYEEAVHMQRANMKADEAHEYGQSEFSPRYPVFNIPSPTAPIPDGIDGGFTNGANGDPSKSTWL